MRTYTHASLASFRMWKCLVPPIRQFFLSVLCTGFSGSCISLWIIFCRSQNPSFPFPNEFGPAAVGVSLQNTKRWYKSQEITFEHFHWTTKKHIDNKRAIDEISRCKKSAAKLVAKSGQHSSRQWADCNNCVPFPTQKEKLVDRFVMPQ